MLLRPPIKIILRVCFRVSVVLVKCRVGWGSVLNVDLVGVQGCQTFSKFIPRHGPKQYGILFVPYVTLKGVEENIMLTCNKVH